MIKTVYTVETELIQDILNLHCYGCPIELDPTYSKGNFYKKITKPRYKFDINPQVEGVHYANAESLPLNNRSIGVTMFDPPFLATSGPSLKIDNNSNKMHKRFGSYPDEDSLHRFYNKAIKELYRITKPGGTLIFKCQDKVSSGKQYFSHIHVYNMALSTGWYAKDLFILVAKNRIVPDWQRKNQKHARKFHSYYWVFQKTGKVNKIY